MKKTGFFFLLFFSIIFSISAQTPKKFFKEGKKEFKAGNYAAASENFTKALDLKPNYAKYLLERAKSFEMQKKFEAALADYKSLLLQKAKDKKLYMKIADLSIFLQEYPDAADRLDKLIALDSRNIAAYQKASFCYLVLKRFTTALDRMNAGLDVQRYNHLSHYYKALALDSMKDLAGANIEYISAIRLMRSEDPNDIKPLPRFKPYFINHAWVMHRLFDDENSLKEFETGLSIDPLDTVEPKNFYVYYLRSQAYLTKTDYINAIGDLNKSLVGSPKFMEAFMQRGKIYKLTSQFQSAISDFTKTIQFSPKYTDAIYSRGQCYLELGNYSEAINDLNKALSLQPGNEEIRKLLQEAQDKNYQANKESDAPMLVLAYPTPDQNNFINVYTEQVDVAFEGQVNDKSLIRDIKINGIKVPFNNTEKNPIFKYKMPINNADKIEIVVTDIYFNNSVKNIKIGRLVDNSRVKVQFSAKVVVGNSNKPYSNRILYITNDRGEIMYFTKTDEDGRFKFEKLPFERSYLMLLDASDPIFAGVEMFKMLDERGNTILVSKNAEKGKFKFDLIPNDPYVMSLMSVDDQPLHIDMVGRLVADNKDKTPISGVKFLLLNDREEVLSFQITDNTGGFNFPELIPSGKYGFSIDALDSKKIPFSKIFVLDEHGRIIKEIGKNGEGIFKFKLLESEKLSLSNISVEDFDPWAKLGNSGSDKKETVIIENIYYESGASRILPEAEMILNKAVEALTKNPKLLLEVQSHTDATAGDEYNIDLSQKRANTVVEYLISKGIDKKRLTAKGYGETQVINRCRNGVDCSDEEHRQNRRTVFKLTLKN